MHHYSKGLRGRKEGAQGDDHGIARSIDLEPKTWNLQPLYRAVLGLEVTSETPGFVILGGVWLGTHSEVHGRNADPARPMVGLTSDDLRVR